MKQWLKANWKIILGVLFVISGLSTLLQDVVTALICIVLGGALIAWWAKGRKKKAPVEMSSSVSSAPKTVDEIISYVPQKKDGAPTAYSFQPTEFNPVEGADLKSIYANKEKYIDAAPNGDLIELRYDGILFGRLESPKIAGMLKDWIKKSDPYSVILRKPGNMVSFIFYRDKRKGQENREQTVTPLTAYKSAKKQETISILAEGDELELEEDYEHEGKVTVSYNGDPIGSLPKKIADRFINEGAYAAFYEGSEETETDNFETVEAPAIRIYW